jgi:O-antigen/teichoic acid export membrane protein
VRRFKTGAFLGISGVMISIYYSLDSVMLGYLRDTGEVGQYAVAYRLPLALIGLAALWGSVLFPYASHLGVHDRETLRGQLGFFSSVAAIVSLPMGVGAILVGDELMPQLFGADFAPAGTPFIILAWAAAIVTFSMSVGTVATALGEERHYVWAVAGGALINVLLNLAAIPLFGMVGAACATVAAEVVVLILIWRRLHTRLGAIKLEWWRIGRAAAATVLMVPAVIALDGVVGAVSQAVVGFVVYAVAAYALGAIRRRELMLALSPRRPV